MKSNILAYFCICFLFFSCHQKQKVDLILHHGIIYTVDSQFTVAEAFAVKDGKFIAIGTSNDILGRYESAKMIDAGGKAVYPGLIDAHCHFYAYGKMQTEVDL